MNRYYLSSVVGLVAAGAAVISMPAAHAQTSQNNSTQNNPASNSQIQGTPTGAAAAGATIQNGRYRTNGSMTGSRTGTSTGASAASATANRRGSASSALNNRAYASYTPILTRAAEMLRESRMRASDAPSGARQSYMAATRAFERMFRTYGASANISATGRGTTVTSSQAADDVRTLRASKRMAAASLYATGAKEFFTAQLRDALLGQSSLPPIVMRGSRQDSRAARNYSAGRTGTASSSVQQPDMTNPNNVDPTAMQNVPQAPQVPPVQVLPGNTVITPGNTIINQPSGNPLPTFNPQTLPQFGAPGTVVPPGTVVTPGTVIIPGTPVVPVAPIAPVVPQPPVVPPTQPAPQP